MAKHKKLPTKLVKSTKTIIPYHYKPIGLSFEKWQTALRRQFVENKSFAIEKTDGLKSPFGDYTVRLGTCKHLEALIFQLKNNSAKYYINPFKEYIPDYTSVYLSYKNGREVKIRIGHNFQSEFEELAKLYFDEDSTLRPEAHNEFMIFLEKAKAIDSDFRCYDDALEFVLEIREHILDEAQRIKNWKTKNAQSVKKIQTPYCLVLTGTPLENKMDKNLFVPMTEQQMDLHAEL